MPKHERDEVANPHRTRIDTDPRPAGKHADEHESVPRRDKQDWREVAEEVKRAVDDADGPLD